MKAAIRRTCANYLISFEFKRIPFTGYRNLPKIILNIFALDSAEESEAFEIQTCYQISSEIGTK